MSEPRPVTEAERPLRSGGFTVLVPAAVDGRNQFADSLGALLTRIQRRTSKPRKFDTLRGSGIEIIERAPVRTGLNPCDESCPHIKADPFGHWARLP